MNHQHVYPVLFYTFGLATNALNVRNNNNNNVVLGNKYRRVGVTLGVAFLRMQQLLLSYSRALV